MINDMINSYALDELLKKSISVLIAKKKKNKQGETPEKISMNIKNI